MNTRSIIFENFRNLGIVDSKQKHLSNKLQLGSIDGEHIGGLLVLLGGNNDGKSNVLDGLVSLANSKLKDSDKPDYRGYKDEPKLTLEYKITDPKILEAITESTSDTQKQSEAKTYIKDTHSSPPKAFRATLTLQRLETDLPKEKEEYKDFDIEEARKHIEKCLSQIYEILENRYYSRNATIEAIQNLQASLCQHKELKSLQRLYENLKNIVKNIVKNDFSLRDNENLQKLLQTPLESFQKDMQRQKDRDVIKEHFGIAFRPKIVLYTENAIAKKDLKVEPSKIDTSSFFQALFTILRKDIAMIQEAYERDDGDYLTITQDEINELLQAQSTNALITCIV